MTIINLREFYPWYIENQFIEVSDAVAEELRASRKAEAAHQRQLTRNKAQYSLDCDDGIEYSACVHEPTPRNCWSVWSFSIACGTPSILCLKRRAAGWTLI